MRYFFDFKFINKNLTPQKNSLISLEYLEIDHLKRNTIYIRKYILFKTWTAVGYKVFAFSQKYQFHFYFFSVNLMIFITIPIYVSDNSHTPIYKYIHFGSQIVCIQFII